MPCLVCDADIFRPLFAKNGYRIGKCSVCDLVQVTNIPSNQKIEEAYDQDFFQTYYGDLPTNTRKQRYEYLNFGNKLDQIEKRIGKKGRLLDVGCSFGFFLDAARQRGWTVTGVELSAYAAAYSRQRFGLDVINKCITQTQCEERSFDVITMWYVIEHLPNPREVLRHLGNLLKDDGVLVVSTANVESYRARLEGKRWRMWIPPEHLLYFSPATIRRLFDVSGFEIYEYESAVPYELYLRMAKLYQVVNMLKLSDNIVYYAGKVKHPPQSGRSEALLARDIL